MGQAENEPDELEQQEPEDQPETVEESHRPETVETAPLEADSEGADTNREQAGREVGAVIDRAIRWVVGLPAPVHAVLLVAIAVLVFPFEQVSGQGFLDAIFSNPVVLWFARVGVVLLVGIGAVFVLRSLADALEQGRFVTGIAGVQLQEQAEKKLRTASLEQRKAEERIDELVEQLETTQTQAQELLDERDKLRKERDELSERLAKLEGSR